MPDVIAPVHSATVDPTGQKNGEAVSIEGEISVAINSQEHLNTESNDAATTAVASVGDVSVAVQDDGQKKVSAMETRRRIMAIRPDALVPATKLFTSNGQEAVKIKMTETGVSSAKPVTIMTRFAEIVEKYPDQLAVAEKNNGRWVKWTYGQYYDSVIRTAKGFIKLGLEPCHAVGIIGFNSPEWFFSDLGAIFAGGYAAGIYTTNTPEACHYVADNCKANIIVAENDIQLQKILAIKERLPHLKAIIQYKGIVKPESKLPFVYTWSEFIEMAEDVDDSLLEERIRAQAPNKCATLIYTSGTTGNPKGVMLSHDNLTFTARSSITTLGLNREVLVSYLPLSHVAAQLIDIYSAIECAGSVYFARADALKGTLGETLREVRPTGFLGVPRVWEKMAEMMKAAGKNISGFKRKVATWAKGVGLKGNLALIDGGQVPFGWTVANAMVFKKARKALGLDRCKFMYSGAAPIAKETVEYFLSLNLPLLEGYGMSESTGPHTACLPGANRIASCGRDMVGFTTSLADADKDGNGEICMSGRHVFMGYLNMEEKTKETLDEMGRLHTGDVGKKDKDGFLFITGRIKELIITAGGENIAPVLIEDVVKEELPIIGNCMLVGDKKKFLSILLCVRTEVDGDAYPTNKLTAAAVDWCRSVGSSATRLQDIVEEKDAKVLEAIQKGVDRANKKAISNAQKIQKWSILPKDFSTPGGELGPTLKLKRPVVNKMYTDTIEAFYA
ncbi:long-chain-fatty-acid--CoA ligase ACSBG2-like isoform X2 [Lineus longissimus]|uniref:long-chain-fatty-acid--CoA ligase ACSBG2-like isoform X2 n=1 Tax=Lineus longissimus TaxID=88925 RepID=UPI002B4C6E41